MSRERYQSSFWVSGTLLAGLTQEEDGFLAYVLESETASLVQSQRFPTEAEALQYVRTLPGEWVLEDLAGCGGGKCGTGACGTSDCPGVCEASQSL